MKETGFPGVPGKGMMPDWYGGLLNDLAARVSGGQRRAIRAVNIEMLVTNWEIGSAILSRQNEEGWGRASSIACLRT